MPSAIEQPIGNVTANAGSAAEKPRARGRDYAGLRALVTEKTKKGLSLSGAALQERRDDRAARKAQAKVTLAPIASASPRCGRPCASCPPSWSGPSWAIQPPRATG